MTRNAGSPLERDCPACEGTGYVWVTCQSDWRRCERCGGSGNLPPLTPHSAEWFEALLLINPGQALWTEQIVCRAGSPDVCGVCGDAPAKDCVVPGSPLRARFCRYCRLVQGARPVSSEDANHD